MSFIDNWFTDRAVFDVYVSIYIENVYLKGILSHSRIFFESLPFCGFCKRRVPGLLYSLKTVRERVGVERRKEEGEDDETHEIIRQKDSVKRHWSYKKKWRVELWSVFRHRTHGDERNFL